MPAATTSVNGYLTSTDWNTFNNKSNTNGTVTSVVALTIGTSGIDITSTAVTTTTTPVITLNIPTASASNRGALSSTDWTTFNNKQATLSLTTTGTSGVATLVANVLNVPNYGSALSGYLPLTGGTLTGALSGTTATFSGLITEGTTVGTRVRLGTGTPPSGETGMGLWATGGNLMTLKGFGDLTIDAAGSLIALSTTGGPISMGGALSGTSATFSGTVLAGQYQIAPSGTNTVYNIVNSDQTYAGLYTTQAGGGSAGYGGGINLFGHSHATKAGYVVAGISANSGGKFTVNNQGNGGGTELFSIDVNGLATLTNALTATSGIFSSTLQTNATFTVGNQFVAGNYVLQVTPSTTTPVQLQGILAGTGTAPIVLQPSGDNVLINTTTSITALTIGGSTSTIYGINLGHNSGGFPSVSRYIGIGNTNGSIAVNSGFSGVEFGGPSSAAEGYLAFHTHDNGVDSGEKMRITKTGVVNAVSRGNFLNATDNALFSLNSGGTLYTVGFSPTATASSTNTFTLTNGTTTWIYTGTGTATWTLPNPSGNNQIYWIKNAGTGAITITAFSGTNIIDNSAASVSTISIAVGGTAVIAQDGNVKSYQLQ